MHSSCDVVIGNTDLVTEIFLRLPVKHVLRCKCVCKKWLALISDPQFCYSHTLRLCHNPYPRALLLQKYDDMDSMKACIVPFTDADNASPSPERIIYLDPPSYFGLTAHLMHSCNGLLLWNVYPRYLYSFYEKEEYFRRCSFYVCNPATSHCVHLDYPSNKFHPRSSKPYFAFEPLKSPHYKVILLGQVRGIIVHGEPGEQISPKFAIKIYSSETSSWSEDGVCVSTPFHIGAIDGVYCNGAIHWYNLGENLVYFDVHRLCFNKLSGPAASADSNVVCVKYFGESGGHLHLILTNSDENLEFDIWMPKEDYSGWILRHHVDLRLIAHQGDAFSWHVNSSFSVLRVVRQANEEESTLIFYANPKIMSYNLKDHSSRILYEVDRIFKSFQYFETLSSTWTGLQLGS